MAPCVEILKVTASDAYKADPSVLDPVMQYVAEAPGSIVIYSGLDIQESQYLWLLVVWESLQHHQALIHNKEVYPKLLEALGKASSKVEFLHHVTFSADIYDALAAPITEVASWDLHESTDPTEFTPLQAGLIDRIHEMSPKILHKGGWGLTHETDKKVFVCLGWDNLEEFKLFIAGAPDIGARLAQMKERASISLSFAKLTKYERK